MNPYTGTNFDDFLAEEDILEEVSARTMKRLLALQIADSADSPRVFASLQGIWQGSIISEQDLEASRLTDPKLP